MVYMTLMMIKMIAMMVSIISVLCLLMAASATRMSVSVSLRAKGAQFSPKNLFARQAVEEICGSPSDWPRRRIIDPVTGIETERAESVAEKVSAVPLIHINWHIQGSPLVQNYEDCVFVAAERFFSVKQGEFFGLVPLLDEEIDRRLKEFDYYKFRPLRYHLEGNIMGYPDKFSILQAYANDERVETICEIGFNSGYSTLFMALQNPKAKFYAFDVFYHNYSALALSTLQEFMPDRDFVGIAGDSTSSVPRFHRMFPDVQCNLIFVDGGHLKEELHMDIENMALLANRTFHRLLVDDTPEGYLLDEYLRFTVVNATEDSKRSMFRDLNPLEIPLPVESYNHSHVKLRHIQQYFVNPQTNPCFDWVYNNVEAGYLHNFVSFKFDKECTVEDGVFIYDRSNGVSVGEYLFQDNT